MSDADLRARVEKALSDIEVDLNFVMASKHSNSLPERKQYA